jgi:hypothetical protein
MIKSSLPVHPKIFKTILICAAVMISLIGQGQLVFSSTANQIEKVSDSHDDTQKDSSDEPQVGAPPMVSNTPVLSSAKITMWIERYEKLSEGIQTGRMDYKVIDAFYWELNAALKDKRDLFREAMAAFTSAPVKNLKSPKKKASSESSQKGSDFFKSEASLPKLNHHVKWFQVAEEHRIDMMTLYNLRIQVLDHVSQELHDRVTGAGIEGVQALKEELDYLTLNMRFRLKLLPQIGKQAAGNMKRAPVPILWSFIQVLIAIFVLFWWRRWAKEGILKARRNILGISPRKPIHKRLAKWLWYLDRVRSPLEWFLFLTIVFGLMVSQERLLLKLLGTKLKYILVAWFMVALIDAMVTRGAAGLKSHAAPIRLKSIWLIALWILLIGLGLGISNDLVGKGTIYAWVWAFSIALILPVVFLLLYWWRPEIYRMIENLPKRPEYIEGVLEHRQSFGGYFRSAFGAVYLIGDTFRQWILRAIASFEWGHYLIASMTRIEALRVSERQRKENRGEPITEEVRRRLYEGEHGIVETVGQDILEQMAVLIEKGQGGAVVIVAERGGGKTQLLERLDGRFEKRMVLFDCPPGGINAFKEALAEALGFQAPEISPERLTERIKTREVSAIGIDNIHRLCRPAMGGQENLNQIAELFRSLSVDLLWLYGVDWAAWQYISRIRANRLFLDAVLQLPLWKEHEIRELIEKRSAHAGIRPDFGELDLPRQLEDMDFETVEERNRFGYYRILWNASDGNPVVALQLWIESLSVDSDGRIIVSLPKLPSTNELEKAHINVLLLLRVIAQSGYASQEEIIDSLRFKDEEVISALAFAQAREWVARDQGRYYLTWKWFRSITRVLARQNLLVRRTIGESS